MIVFKILYPLPNYPPKRLKQLQKKRETINTFTIRVQLIFLLFHTFLCTLNGQIHIFSKPKNEI